jgi:hypothetical protein
MTSGITSARIKYDMSARRGTMSQLSSYLFSPASCMPQQGGTNEPKDRSECTSLYIFFSAHVCVLHKCAFAVSEQLFSTTGEAHVHSGGGTLPAVMCGYLLQT